MTEDTGTNGFADRSFASAYLVVGAAGSATWLSIWGFASQQLDNPEIHAVFLSDVHVIAFISAIAISNAFFCGISHAAIRIGLGIDSFRSWALGLRNGVFIVGYLSTFATAVILLTGVWWSFDQMATYRPEICHAWDRILGNCTGLGVPFPAQ